MKIEQKEIYLVPFSDFSKNKVRPVLVVSNDKFNVKSEDVIVCGVTSNVTKDFYNVDITNKDLKEGKLYSSSIVKVENILRVDKKLLIKKIGRVKEKTIRKVIRKLISLF